MNYTMIRSNIRGYLGTSPLTHYIIDLQVSYYEQELVLVY